MIPLNDLNDGLPVQAGFVFLGIFALLLFMGLVVQVIEARNLSSTQKSNLTLHQIRSQIYSWWVMAVVLLFAFWFGRIGTGILFLLISFAALREFMTLVYRRKGDHYAVVACFYLLLPLQYYFVVSDWYGMFSALIPVYAFLILPIITSLSGDVGSFFERTAKIQWGAMITIYCLSHVPALMNLHIPGFEGRNILLLIFMIAVVQFSEVLQFICGKLFGKRPVLPALSTQTSWWCVFGALGGGTAVAASLWWLTPFTPLQAAATGLLLSIMGFFGGLVMSAIKQSFGISMWGRRTRSHGGMIDRVDNICFAAPIFFHIVHYYWVP